MLPLENKKNLKINDLGIELEKLEKQQIRLKTSRREEVINIEAEINEVKSNHTIKSID